MYNLTFIYPFCSKAAVFSKLVHILRTSWWMDAYPRKSTENTLGLDEPITKIRSRVMAA